MKRLINSLALLFFLSVAGYYAYQAVYPCAQPVIYSIGPVDEQFGLSAEDFRAAVHDAVALWEGSAGKVLFVEKPSGGMPISAVYDHRQDGVKKLQELGMQLDSTEQSYQALLTQHQTLKQAYDRATAAYETQAKAFENRKKAYETKVKDTEQRQLTEQEFNQLEAERQAINAQIPVLEKSFNAVEKQRKDLNGVVSVLNRMAAQHNESVDAYRGVGQTLGGQYEAGVYERQGGQERITVYAFGGPSDLRSLLAHELGHALGLPHLEDKTAIMYRLNESGNTKLAQADVEALKDRCGL